jgi:hypothetical protein
MDGIMKQLLGLAALLAATWAEAVGQVPPAPVVGPPVVWGGYPVADPVGYQPLPPGTTYTLPPQVALPPQEIATPNAPGQVWQTYPGPGTMPPPGTIGPATIPSLPPPDRSFPAAPGTSPQDSLLPPGTRSGVFQKVKFTGTWLPQPDDDDLGWTDLKTEVVFGLPFFTRETPIVITPTYELHFLDRPDGLGLPPRLHDLSIDFHHFRRVGDHWIADFAITPGLFGDEHSLDSEEACRINGRALGVYTPTPEWKWVLGATYVNGGWAKIVPIAGVVYEPHDAVEYELVFPAPRAAWRLPNSPLPGQDEYWFYIAGEFASSIWAFEHPDGTDDTFAYRDFRALLGIERKIIGGLSSRAEVGYVFRREIKIASSGPDETDLDGTYLLRVGLIY